MEENKPCASEKENIKPDFYRESSPRGAQTRFNLVRKPATGARERRASASKPGATAQTRRASASKLAAFAEKRRTSVSRPPVGRRGGADAATGGGGGAGVSDATMATSNRGADRDLRHPSSGMCQHLNMNQCQ